MSEFLNNEVSVSGSESSDDEDIVHSSIDDFINDNTQSSQEPYDDRILAYDSDNEKTRFGCDSDSDDNKILEASDEETASPINNKRSRDYVAPENPSNMRRINIEDSLTNIQIESQEPQIYLNQEIPLTKAFDYLMNDGDQWGIVDDNLVYIGSSYCSDYVRDMDTHLQDNDILIECSPKGSRKTTKIGEYLAMRLQENPSLYVRCITPRTIFASYFTKDINKILEDNDVTQRIVDYKKKERGINLHDEKMIAIQLDSILRIFKKFDVQSGSKCDILILDEIKSILRYVSSKNIEKTKCQVVYAFVKLLTSANKVILADGDFDQTCLNILNHLLKGQRKRVCISINKTKNDFRLYNIYPTKGQVFEKIEQSLNENKRIVITTNSKFMSYVANAFVKNKFSHLKVLLINADTTQNTDLKDIAFDCDKWIDWIDEDGNLISGYDVIIYSPSITVGVSFNYDNCFSTVFAFFVRFSSVACECMQMLQRFRKTDDVHMYIPDSKNENFEIDELQIINLLQKRHSKLKERLSDPYFTEQKQTFKIPEDIQEFLMDNIVIIDKANILEQRESNSNLKVKIIEVIRKYIVDENQIITHEKSKTKIKLNEMKEFIKEHTARMIYEAEDISLETVNQILKRLDRTEDEAWSMRKYWCKQNYHKSELDYNFIYKWETQYKKVLAFKHIFVSDSSDVKFEDKWMMEAKSGNHPIFLNFVMDQKTNLTKILEIYGFNIYEPWKFSFNPKESRINTSELDEILKTMVYANRSISLPTLTEGKGLMKLIIDVFGLLNLRLKKYTKKQGEKRIITYELDHSVLLDMLMIMIDVESNLNKDKTIDLIKDYLDRGIEYYESKVPIDHNTQVNSQLSNSQLTDSQNSNMEFDQLTQDEIDFFFEE